MMGDVARKTNALLVGVCVLLLAAAVLFATPAWADDGFCGRAYLDPDDPGAGDSSTYTLVIQKQQRKSGRGYIELGRIPNNHNGENLPWSDERYDTFVAKTKRIIVCSSGGLVSPTSTDSWFSGFSNVESIDLSGLDTKRVTDMSDMFSGCARLSSLDLSTFDTSNVTDMSGW